MLVQVMTNWEMLIQVRTGEALLPHVRQVWARLGQIMTC
jgi:hypothetical protein